MSFRTMILPATRIDENGKRVYEREPYIVDMSDQFGQEPYGGFVTIGPGLSTLLVGPLRENRDLTKKLK